MSTDAVPELIESYASKISSHWHKAASEILEVARLCVEAHAKLGSEGRKQLVEKLPFDHSRFSMLLKIGRNVRINTPEVRQLLPPSFTTIYEVAQLTEGELQTAIKTKILHPESRRADFQKWRKSNVVPKGAAKLPLYARVHLTKKLSSEEMDRLREGLDQLGSAFGLKIARPEDYHNQRSGNWGERFMGHMRREARKVVRSFLRNKVAGSPGKKLGDAGWIEDEISIESRDGEHRIMQVLASIGSEDELNGIRTRALKKCGEPKGPYMYWPLDNEVIDPAILDSFPSSRKKKKNDITRFADFT